VALDACDKNEEKHIFKQQQQNNCPFSSKKMNIISTSTGFVLLSKLLSQALFSTLHPFGFEGGKGGVVIARPRVKRRSSSLDFVSHNEKNKLLAESLFFLFVVSLFVLSSRTRKNTQRTQKKKKTRWCAVLVENIEYEAKERAEEGEESVITPTFEDECKEEEEDKEEEEKEDEFLTSDDSESSLQCEDEELEQRDQRWEIVAKLPPVVACEEKRSSSSLLEAWMSAVPRKGKRKLKAVGFGRDTGNGFFKDLTECNFRVEVFRCIDERRAKREEEGERSDGSFEKRRRVEIDEEDNDD